MKEGIFTFYFDKTELLLRSYKEGNVKMNLQEKM
jgi:hypothetical protein